MSPEAQRIAIAEACAPGSSVMPDYLNDLNAMHEAEKVLTDHTGYCMNLQIATGGLPLRFNLVFSTAAQRAEAFLRTLNLHAHP